MLLLLNVLKGWEALRQKRFLPARKGPCAGVFFETPPFNQKLPPHTSICLYSEEILRAFEIIIVRGVLRLHLKAGSETYLNS